MCYFHLRQNLLKFLVICTYRSIIIKRGRGRPKNQIMLNALANEDKTQKKKPTKVKKSKSHKNE